MKLTEPQKRHLRLFLDDAFADTELSPDCESLELDSYVVPEVSIPVVKNLKEKQLILNYEVHGRDNTAVAVEFSPKQLRALQSQGII